MTKEINELKKKLQISEEELQKSQNKHKEKLKNLKETNENELKSLQEQIKELYKQNSNQKTIEMNQIIEDLKKEKYKFENLVSSNKLSYMEEKNFLDTELKRAEEQAVDAKMKYAQVSLDKDYYQMKYQQLVKEVKKRNIDIKF